jgi:CO dehydrogenase/acetyl-CoA synthase delta subunit
VVAAVVAMSELATELGDVVVALDINPLVAGPSGAVAADVLVEAAAADVSR